MAKQHYAIGTSGWAYDDWRGSFYPEDLPKHAWLEFYSRYFNVTEVNNTFYQLPKPRTLENWRDTVPKNFSFATKASRYITHMKKLKQPAESGKNFFDCVDTLDQHLGPVLFQLPPKWRFNSDRLQNFLQSLVAKRRYAFEFRDPSWLNDHTYELLARYNAALCIYHLEGYISPQALTADFVYLRLHGPVGAYKGSYPKQQLHHWAKSISDWWIHAVSALERISMTSSSVVCRKSR